MALGGDDTRLLIAEIEGDADSMSLLESWLDASRPGWREYFSQQSEAGYSGPRSSSDQLTEAYRILGLQPGATDDEVRAAHRDLMQAVHPDHGGSSINNVFRLTVR